MPGATITAASPSLQGTRQAVTSPDGDYIIPFLPAGDYTVSFELTGFRKLARKLRLQLADDIVCGALPPGSPLDESDLARRFGVSRTPVGEAIRQLTASGLVDSRAHRGAVVARPNIQRLNSMFEAMAELEALAPACPPNV